VAHTADHFQDWRLLDPLFRQQSLEGGCFENAEPDVKANCGHDDAQQDRAKLRAAGGALDF
jgi:hypothetical protein